jgi:hypothetical protein
VDWCARERGIVTTESSCSAVLSATRTTTDTPSAVATADEALSSESHGTINVTWFVHSMVFIGALLLLILLIECATGKTIIQPRMCSSYSLMLHAQNHRNNVVAILCIC